MKQTKYEIIERDTMENLQDVVNQALADGMTLVGGVVIETTHHAGINDGVHSSHRYCQAVVKNGF